MNKTIDDVEQFWNANLCGKQFIKSKYPSKEFFEEYNAYRYRKTHHLLKYINWEEAKNKSILEIGLGIGADAVRWATYAASFTGIDLTEESVIATTRHFEYKGLNGQIILANAENLPFKENQFDMIYSQGVLHHTPNINTALKEIYRVLKPEGKLIIMLYCKNSFNYWIRIQFWFRIRMLIELLKHKTGLSSNALWKQHIENFNKKKWKYFSWNEWPHHCTDGPGCNIANIYTPGEARKLLERNGFAVIRIRKAHFPAGLPSSLERKLSRLIGFHQLIWAVKF